MLRIPDSHGPARANNAFSLLLVVLGPTSRACNEPKKVNHRHLASKVKKEAAIERQFKIFGFRVLLACAKLGHINRGMTSNDSLPVVARLVADGLWVIGKDRLCVGRMSSATRTGGERRKPHHTGVGMGRDGPLDVWWSHPVFDCEINTFKSGIRSNPVLQANAS